MRGLAAIYLGCALAGVCTSVPARSASRLDRIRETGVIAIGHPQASVPFAFFDANQKPIGYAVEICEQVAQKLKERLGLAKLEVRYTTVTSATRIPLIDNGTIDLECGTTTNLVDRHKYVAFAPTTFVAQIVLTARKDAAVDVNNLASFNGKSIAAQAGGETFKVVSQLSAKNGYGITVVPTKDGAQTFMMMESGRTAASVNDDGLAYAAVATSRTPDAFAISAKGLEFSPYGIVEPKDDPAFKNAVDTAVIELMKSGKIAEIYEKYFNAPIPPRGINLKYPMSDALKRALQNPTDSGDPAAYE